MSAIDFGMPTLIENTTLSDNIDLCSQLGLQFIELNMNFPEYQIDRLTDTAPFYQAAEKAGIYYTIHLDETLNPADFNPLVRNAYLETVRRVITAAKKLLPLAKKNGSAPMIINMHMNHGIHITLPGRKMQMYERDFETYYSHFRDFGIQVEEWIGSDNLLITIENTDGFRAYEKIAVDLLLQHKCFGLTWDIGHSKAASETDLPYILSHGKKLCHMHIHDGTETPQRNHLALGTGEIDLCSRLETAVETSSRCVLETKTVAALKDSVRWLTDRNLFRQPVPDPAHTVHA